MKKGLFITLVISMAMLFLGGIHLQRFPLVSSLISENVEALTQSETGNGGYPGMRDKVLSGGVTTVTVSPWGNGTVTFLGITLSLKPGKTYCISYTVWDCETYPDQTVTCTPRGTEVNSIEL